jgi:hypothetical protein
MTGYRLGVLPVLVAGLVGAVIGALGRPHGRHLATPVLILPSAVVAGAGIHFAVGTFDLPAEMQLFAASLALLTGFAVVNRHIVGMGVLAIGLCANLLAVVLHTGMPVRPSALVAAGVVPAEDLVHTDLGAGRRFARTGDLLPQLGDIIPVEVFGAAMSFGDLIALMGIASVAGELARYARRGGRWSLADTITWSRHVLTDRSPAAGDHADGDDDGETIDLTDDGPFSGSQRFPAQPVREVGIDGESVRVIDVGEHVEQLDRRGDVVDAEDRVLR